MLLHKVFALLALCLGQFTLGAPWKSIPVSRTLVISGKPYYVSAEPLVELEPSQFSLGALDVLPITVFSSNNDTVTGVQLENRMNQWIQSDDVFDDAFLQGESLATNLSYDIDEVQVLSYNTQGTVKVLCPHLRSNSCKV